MNIFLDILVFPAHASYIESSFPEALMMVSVVRPQITIKELD